MSKCHIVGNHMSRLIYIFVLKTSSAFYVCCTFQVRFRPDYMEANTMTDLAPLWVAIHYLTFVERYRWGQPIVYKTPGLPTVETAPFANSEVQDEMPRDMSFHLCLHCLLQKGSIQRQGMRGSRRVQLWQRFLLNLWGEGWSKYRNTAGVPMVAQHWMLAW